MPRSPLILLLLSVSLTGCFRNSNVKGDFACKAPDGTCAPMTVIDGSALSAIGGGGAPIGAIRSPGSLPPPSAPMRTVAAGADDPTAPARTAERVLRVVFPAHIDKDGVYREEAAAHAVIEPTAWAQALGGPAAEPRRMPALRQGGAMAAVPASDVHATPASGSLLASMDEVVAAQAARRSSAAVAVPPAPAVTAAPSAPQPVSPPAAPRQGASISHFATPSRAAQPLTLAEAAAGLAAPPIARLDPGGPGNYDTPEVTAAVGPALGPQPAPGSATKPAHPPANAVMRTVRWEGKFYTIPVAKPADVPPDSSAPSTLTTADLNRRALARADKGASAGGAEAKGVGTGAPSSPAIQEQTGLADPPPAPAAPPPSSPTADAAVAREQVRLMAARQLQALARQDGSVVLAPAAATPVEEAPRP